MVNFERAVAVVRLRQLATEEENAALSVLIEDGMRMRKALMFYADENNYFDGVPMLKDPQTGLFTVDDEGAVAKQGLRLVDVSLGVMVKVPKEPEVVTNDVDQT